MKRVIWTDRDGWKHANLLRDVDPDSEAVFGIPDDPPDMSQVLENFKKVLHNRLVESGITSYRDLVNQQDGISAILNILRRDVVNTFRFNETKENS